MAWFGTQHIVVLRSAVTWLDDIRLAYLGPPRTAISDLVVLTITEDTLSRFPFRSPLDRSFLAALLDELARKDVRAVGLDIIFDQATVPEDDARLLRAIRAFPKPVIIAVGDRSNGLTPRQVEFQSSYLAEQQLGSAGLLITDGVVRHFYPGRSVNEQFQPSFTAALAEAVGVEFPALPQLIDYRARTNTGAPAIRSFPTHTLALLPDDWFKNAIVLIGADLPNEDRYRTPLSVLGNDFTTMAGVQIHAQALAQLIGETSFPVSGPTAGALLLAGAALLGFLLPLANVHVLVKTAASVAVIGSYWVLCFLAFMRGGTLLPVLPPTLAFLLSLSFSSAYGRYRERTEKRFVRAAFGHYVSPAVIDAILENPAKLKLGGEQREMSYVFTDLAGFTALSESLPPEAVVSLLQQYFEGLLQIGLRLGGTIDRLVGDGINVIFGAPALQADHASRAVRCALECDRYSESFRQRKLAEGVDLGVTRIGVHTGPGVVGNVGSSKRFQYTAHGDAINTAARLEGANKLLGTRVCLSREVAAHYTQESFVPVGHLLLRGKTKGLDCVTACAVLDGIAVDKYRDAYALMEKHDPAAQAAFASLASEYPDNTLVSLHLRRLAGGATGTTITMEDAR